jgi:hypothetical protein
VLSGADGVVFVGDSQRTMKSSNIDSFKNLQENLLLQGISLDGFPHALQFNKRDLKGIVSVEELDDDLNIYRAPIFESVATEGIGVQETLEGIVKLVMRSLRDRYEGATTGARIPGVVESTVSRKSVSVPEPPPGPTAVPTPEPFPVAPSPAPPPADQEPAPPDARFFTPETGAETVDLSESSDPETIEGAATGGFEDEIATGVYELSDEETGALQDLGRPAQPDMPAAMEPETPAAASTPDFDMGSTVIDDAPPPSVLDVGGELFGQMAPDPTIEEPKAEMVENVSTLDEMEIPDFELDIPSDEKAPEFDAPPAAAEPEAPESEAVAPPSEPELLELEVVTSPAEPEGLELEVVTPPAEPEGPELEAVTPPAEPEGLELEVVTPPAEPEGLELEAATSLSVDPEASGLEVMPPEAEPEIPGIEFISTLEEEAAPPPTGLTPPSERYEDRIEAPSPFAPQAPAGVEDVPQVLGEAVDLEAWDVADAEPAVIAPEVESVVAEAEADILGEAADLEAWDVADAEPAVIVTEVESAIAEAEADMLGEVADREAWDVADAEPAVIAPEVESAIAEAEADISGEAAPEPVMVGNGDPWSEEELTETLEVSEAEEHEPAAAIEEADHREIAVSAQDNQLHLRLQGTGAIIESGQVRAIDIEVPVPGSWVGNRRVTLQLRLTLTPDTEDENGGSGGPS